MSELFRDLRHAWRSLVRTPAYTVVAVATLALGIGVNTAVFSTVNAVLLRPLPFPDSDRLVHVWSAGDAEERGAVSPPDFVDWRAQSRSFASMAAYRNAATTLSGADGAERIPGARVTGGFFEAFGARPALGRAIDGANERPGSDQVVVLSHAFWQTRFGGARDIIGTWVRLDGVSHEVVGVAPAGFAFPAGAELWLPQSFTENDLTTQRGAHYLTVVARLAAGVSVEGADAEMERVAALIAARHADTNAGLTARVEPLRDTLVGEVRPALLVLLGAVGLVLLIACVNVANLTLARSLARVREAAIRAALGASRRRLVREALVESAVVGLGGGIAGTLLGWWTADLLWGVEAVRLPRLEGASLDPTVLAFAAGATILTVMAFGLAPALRAGGMHHVSGILKERGPAASRAAERLRATLVVAEIALALVLLAGAGLLLRSFAALGAVDLGFRTERLLTFSVTLPDVGYDDPAAARAFFAAYTGSLAAMPDADAVGAASMVPLGGGNYFISVERIDGAPAYNAPGEEPYVQLRIVTPGFFEALGVPLRGGRALGPADRQGAPLAAIVNEAAARLLWPGQDAVGRTVEVGTRLGLGGARAGGEVVGVVADVRDRGPALAARPTLYVAHAQFPVGGMDFVVRTQGSPAALVAAARDRLRALDPEIPLARIRTGDELAAEPLARARLYTLLLLVFAGVALALAVLGIYGLIAYVVAQRRREVGVRMALGARSRDVLRLVLRRAAILVAAGSAIGVAAALAATRTLQSMLFGVTPHDPATLAAGCAVLSLVALAAAWLPARRAARVDPSIVLREE